MPEDSIDLSKRRCVLVLGDSHSYNLDAFDQAATRLGALAVVATDRCHVLADAWAETLEDRLLAVNLRDEAQAFEQVLASGFAARIDAVISVSDKTQVLAARIAESLGLRHNHPEAARATRSKVAMREALARGGVRQPRFRCFAADSAPERVAGEVEYPCVLKPVLLSASRGVIRADDPDAFVSAWRRVTTILAAPELKAGGDPDSGKILVEQFVPGIEVALEVLVDDGEVEVLAIFDKPDPLDGPFFEETLYVTPSRLAPERQARLRAAASAACQALSLRHGPAHLELRDDGLDCSVIEVAARTIGGLCSRTLQFGTGITLEELVLRHSLGLPRVERSGPPAAGVMMLPIPRAGLLKAVHGIEAARSGVLIEEVVISIRPGEEVIPLPEGNRYLGFVFARGESPSAVEDALRAAHRSLRFEIVPRLAEVR